MMEVSIIEVSTPDQLAQATALFREYQEWLGLKLCFQNFDEEVATLPGKYAAPTGRLLLAYTDFRAAGCVALRKLEDGICEMKRLFVRDEFRGRNIGVKLLERIIGEARALGYAKMRLDTFPPRMGKAVSLYEAYGFYEIPAYYHNPFGETLYMEKDLTV